MSSGRSPRSIPWTAADRIALHCRTTVTSVQGHVVERETGSQSRRWWLRGADWDESSESWRRFAKIQ